MKFLATLIATAALAWGLGLWLPYWSLSFAAVLIGFLIQPGELKALLAGLIAGGLLWGILAYTADLANGHVLSARIATIFGTTSVAMVGITALLGAMLAGLGTWLGDRIRQGVD